jgi:hypothetical protein
MIKIATWVTLCYFSCLSAAAQSRLSAEKHFFHGFYLGLETQNIAVSPISRVAPGSESVEFKTRKSGMALGWWARWRLIKQLSFQAELGVFRIRNTAVLKSDHQVHYLNYAFTDVELPLHFIVASPLGNLPFKSVLVVGGRLGVNTINQPQNQGITLFRERWALDIGLGLEFQLGPFKMQPELMYSYCMNNIHDFGGATFDGYVDRVVRDRLGMRVLIRRSRKGANPPPFRPG